VRSGFVFRKSSLPSISRPYIGREMLRVADSDDPARASGTIQPRDRCFRIDLLVGVVLSVAIVVLHGVRLIHAGPLWRDEAGVVQLASLPTVGNVFHNFAHEAFPMAFQLCIRAFAQLTGGGDFAFRCFGFLVGVLVVGALWWNVWTIARRPPLLSLALLGFNGAMLQWGDSIRGYGLATALGLLAAGVGWRLAERATPGRFAAALLTFVACVHCLIPACVLVAAICAAGMLVAIRDKDNRRAVAVFLAGAIAALSLLPYWGEFAAARQWDIVLRKPVILGDIAVRFGTALESSGSWNALIWVVLALCAAFGILAGKPTTDPTPSLQADFRIAVYFRAVLIGTVAGYFVFLLALGYPTESWYYLAPMGLIALCLDMVVGSTNRIVPMRLLRTGLAVFVAATSVVPAWRQALVRQTNVDVIAGKIGELAREGDLVIIMPWYDGISFMRYYRGPPAWVTVPPVASHMFHRYDQIMSFMIMTDQTEPFRPVLDRIRQAFETGHSVWVAGEPPEVPPVDQVQEPAAAPGDEFGWNNDAYTK
jgi:hypothetical protein